MDSTIIPRRHGWQTNFSLLVLMVTLSSIPNMIYAQKSAVDWFKKGMNSFSPDEKIHAFEKVIELDPNYTEGYYYLGIAYKSKQMYPEAEIALNRAYFKNPYILSNHIKTQILYELGIVYEVLGKQVQAEDALRGAKGLTSKTDKIRGQICFRLGQLYAKQEKIDEAIAEFSEGKNILPQDGARFSQALVETQAKKNLNDQYNQGLSLLTTGRYEKALEKFNRIIQLQPDYKNVQSKAKEVQKLLDEQEKSRASTNLNKAITKAPNNELKDGALKLKDFQRQNPSKLAEEDSAKKYEQQERTAFQRKKRQEGTDSPPLRNQPYAGHKKNLNDHHALSSVEISKTDSLFGAGVSALRNSDWLDAILAFEKVKLLDPGYPDINNKLADAHFNYEKRNTPSNKYNETDGNGITLSKTLASLMVVPLVLAFILIAPGARARLYLIRGDYLKASEIYQRLLMKNPGRLKLYSILANIYLLENRRDRIAMEIFETIIKMNLYTRKKQEINTIVAHHYLTEGRQDATAIAVMERELDSRLQNLNGE